jgi:hypothetical protein
MKSSTRGLLVLCPKLCPWRKVLDRFSPISTDTTTQKKEQTMTRIASIHEVFQAMACLSCLDFGTKGCRFDSCWARSFLLSELQDVPGPVLSIDQASSTAPSLSYCFLVTRGRNMGRGDERRGRVWTGAAIGSGRSQRPDPMEKAGRIR